jgi:hypothetical protein
VILTHYMKKSEKWCFYCYLNRVSQDYFPREASRRYDKTYELGGQGYCWVYDKYFRLKNLDKEELDEELELAKYYLMEEKETLREVL